MSTDCAIRKRELERAENLCKNKKKNQQAEKKKKQSLKFEFFITSKTFNTHFI
jgi:hypothetical protein